MRLAFLLALTLAGCGETVKDDHFANNMVGTRAEPERTQPQAVAVRIGEAGPSFAACNTAGTTRNLDPADGDMLTVRAAPFDTAAEAGTIAPGARFFVCTRSLDQRWMGVVWDASGTLAQACRVSSPVASRRKYEGPCGSGWVSSAYVKLVAG